MKNQACYLKTKLKNKVIICLSFASYLFSKRRVLLVFTYLLISGLPVVKCFAQQELLSTPLYNDANLVSYYRLEGNSNDAKGSNNGSSSNVTFGNSYGKFGQGASLNGTSSYIDNGTNSSLNISPRISITAWCYFNSTDANQVLAGKYNTPTGQQYLFIVSPGSNGNIGFYYSPYGNTSVSTPGVSGINIPTGQWLHLAGVLDASTSDVTFYVNGNSVGTAHDVQGFTSIYSGTTSFKIGKRSDGYWFYNGYIDDVAVFNRTLTSTEIYKLYNGFSTVTLGANAPSEANQCAGTTKVVIQSFSLAVTNSDGNLTNVGFTTTGSYIQADITKYQLWYRATTNDISGASQLGTDLASSGNAGARTFAAFSSPTLTIGTTYYFWITADIASGTTNNNTIAVNAITTGDLTSTSSKTGSTSVGGTQTLKANPTAATNSSAQTIYTIGNATLSGNNPAVGTGVWSITGGPSTSSSQFGSTTVYNTTFTPAGGAGSYVVRWTISNSPCTSSSADATITVIAPTPAIVDWNKSNVQEITLTSLRSLTFANGMSGGVYTLIIKQDGTGGRTLTWPTGIKWTGGTPPSLTTSSNVINVIKFVFDGTDYIETGILLDVR
ncbi:MAG: LamG domain-containing protein [Bacteroidetes bacterium]|nr:LamG domain-containing protein [Bacteroidota bacterium]